MTRVRALRGSVLVSTGGSILVSAEATLASTLLTTAAPLARIASMTNHTCLPLRSLLPSLKAKVVMGTVADDQAELGRLHQASTLLRGLVGAVRYRPSPPPPPAAAPWCRKWRSRNV